MADFPLIDGLPQEEYETARQKLRGLHEQYGFMRMDCDPKNIPIEAHQERKRLSAIVERGAWKAWKAIPKQERKKLKQMVYVAKRNIKQV